MDQLTDTMLHSWLRTLSTAAALAVPALWALTAHSADRDALRHIVQDQCLPHWRERHDPAPCVRVALPDFAVLADRKGGAHYLLIATAAVTGIEDPALLEPGTPNYFAAAWQARDQLDAAVGHPLPRDAVGLAVNSAILRGQDQLHIHIECVKPGIYRELHAAAASLGDHWRALSIDGHVYSALRIDGEDLTHADPVALLASGLPDSRADMRAVTIVVVGMQFTDGAGFIALTGRTPAGAEAALMPVQHGLVPAGETLLDSTCAVDSAQR
jgi:CDP-diacylglycerol pyrophosphatase